MFSAVFNFVRNLFYGSTSEGAIDNDHYDYLLECAKGADRARSIFSLPMNYILDNLEEQLICYDSVIQNYYKGLLHKIIVEYMPQFETLIPYGKIECMDLTDPLIFDVPANKVQEYVFEQTLLNIRTKMFFVVYQCISDITINGQKVNMYEQRFSAEELIFIATLFHANFDEILVREILELLIIIHNPSFKGIDQDEIKQKIDGVVKDIVGSKKNDMCKKLFERSMKRSIEHNSDHSMEEEDDYDDVFAPIVFPEHNSDHSMEEEDDYDELSAPIVFPKK